MGKTGDKQELTRRHPSSPPGRWASPGRRKRNHPRVRPVGSWRSRLEERENLGEDIREWTGNRL